MLFQKFQKVLNNILFTLFFLSDPFITQLGFNPDLIYTSIVSRHSSDIFSVHSVDIVVMILLCSCFSNCTVYVQRVSKTRLYRGNIV